MRYRGSVAAAEGQPAAVVPSSTGLVVQAQVCALWPLPASLVTGLASLTSCIP